FDGFRHGTSVDRALKTDLRWYLADDILTLTDRLSMWHSLELRVPYLDHRFVEEVMSIPANLKIRGFNQKRILKQVAAKWLPAPVIKHRKQGFEAPMGRWLRGPLKSLMQDTLGAACLAERGTCEAPETGRRQSAHLSGARRDGKVVSSRLMCELWLARQHAAAAPAAGQMRRRCLALPREPQLEH